MPDVSAASRESFGFVRESDLDILLVLEGRTSGALVRHLIEAGGLHAEGEIRARRSTHRTTDPRETDVEVTWLGGRLLIENKIDAALSAGQSASYRAEIVTRRSQGEDTAAVLLCPGWREPGLRDQTGSDFDAVVIFEDLADEADRLGDPLSRAIGTWLRAAARPKASIDADRSAWGDGYRAALASLSADQVVLMPGPGSLRSPTATVAEFASAVGIEEVWKLGHHILAGKVVMELDVAPDRIVGHEETGALHLPKRRMQYLEIGVPAMDFEAPADEQLDALSGAARAVATLHEWAITHLR